MHEVAIAQSILRAALHHLQSSGGGRISRIHCRIGSLAGIEISALEFCFPFVVEGSPAQGAELSISEELAQGTCPACKTQCEIRSFFDPCPHCQHWPLSLTGGRDMLLTTIDILPEEV